MWEEPQKQHTWSTSDQQGSHSCKHWWGSVKHWYHQCYTKQENIVWFLLGKYYWEKGEVVTITAASEQHGNSGKYQSFTKGCDVYQGLTFSKAYQNWHMSYTPGHVICHLKLFW